MNDPLIIIGIIGSMAGVLLTVIICHWLTGWIETLDDKIGEA